MDKNKTILLIAIVTIAGILIVTTDFRKPKFRYFEKNGQMYGVDIMKTSFSVLEIKNMPKGKLMATFSASVTCYFCDSPGDSGCTDVILLNGDCDDDPGNFWSKSTCEEQTSCGGGDTSCSNPDGDEGQFSCEYGYIYKCESGDWNYDSECQSGDCSGDVAGNRWDVCTHPGCSNPDGDDGDVYCENGDVYECEGNDWDFYDECKDISDGYSGDCEVEDEAEDWLDEVCEEQTCNSHDYKQCYNDDVYWYDSCDSREDKAQECGGAGCSSAECQEVIIQTLSTTLENVNEDDGYDVTFDVGWQGGSSPYDLDVDYGDGNSDSFSPSGTYKSFTHQYSEDDTYSYEIQVIGNDGSSDTQTGSYTVAGDGRICRFNDGNCRSSCQSNEESRSILNDCSSGVCCVAKQCDSNYDSNNDGTISRTELGSAITDWINEDLTRNKLGIAIQEWANGC